MEFVDHFLLTNNSCIYKQLVVRFLLVEDGQALFDDL